jgi:hypothetical protein
LVLVGLQQVQAQQAVQIAHFLRLEQHRLVGAMEARTTTTPTILQALVALVVVRHITHTTGLELLGKVMLAEQAQRYLGMVLAVVVAQEPWVKMEQLF